MFKGKWNKYGISAAVTLTILAVIYMIQLNFGDYIDQVWRAFQSVLIPAAIALFIVYLIAPLNRYFKRKGLQKNLSAVLSISIFTLVLLSFIGLIALLLTQQVMNIVPVIQDNWESIMEWVASVTNQLPTPIITDQNQIDWAAVLELIVGKDAGKILGGLNAVIYYIIMIVMTPVFLFFFLREGDNIFSGFVKVIPKRWYRDDLEIIMKFANSSTEKYIRGKLISILFLGLFFSIGFSIIFIVLGELPIMSAILYGVLFGFILAMLDLIPYIGPTIGVILPVLFLLMMSGFGTTFVIFATILVIVNFAGQNLQKILIEPVIMSKEVEVHPLAVFTGLLFFGALFGFVGLILATPIVATVRSVYNYLRGKYSKETIENIINEDLNKDGNIGEIEEIDFSEMKKKLSEQLESGKGE